jgi:polar amino acid transport system permease protein
MADKGQRSPVIEVGDGAAIPRPSDVGLFTAWRVAFFGAIAAIAYLAVTRPATSRS